MAFKGRFALGLAGWLVLIVGATFAFICSVRTPGLGVVRLVAAIGWAGAVAGLWNHVWRTNVRLARFVDAIRFGDLSQNFAVDDEGAGFADLSAALNDALRQLRDERQQLGDDRRFYEAVLDDTPTALLIIDDQDRVEVANKAARRLFMKHRGVRVGDFQSYGQAFVETIADPVAGRARLVPLVFNGMPQTAMVSAAVVHRLGSLVRVIAVQPIQSELNAVEIAAQSDLIRVLTHEIMNSMTPVTSLAHTAADLIAQADTGENRAVADARDAVETLARRADGVMNFVDAYRQISRTPKIRRRVFAVAPWAAELAAMFKASGVPAELNFQMTVEPEDLTIDADPDLLFQVLINLLKNAAEAGGGEEGRQISLHFSSRNGGLTAIEVADNGPGIPQGLQQDVFLPFFTTKTTGTGIGLSLARQIVLAHQGSIALDSNPSGGSTFRILI